MDRYLFTDGTNGVREVHSKKELLSLIHSAATPGHCRIWMFSTNAWTDYPSLLRLHPGFEKEAKQPPSNGIALAGRRNNARRLQRFFFLIVLLAGTMLAFNFSSARWEPGEPLTTVSPRPANVPLMDFDSLVNAIETSRGRSLDKNTKNNLRLRNNWPDYLFLRLRADKEVKGSNHRFMHLELSIDNATGMLIDQAVVQLRLWKNGKNMNTDTFRFDSLPYDRMQVRKQDFVFHADSISANFLSIRAKAFNFCYSSDVENGSGNPNDRWFCPEGKSRK